MSNRFASLAAAVVLLASPLALAAEMPTFELAIKDHKFVPPEITVPADTRVKLVIHNQDPTAAEFESHDFRAEKIIPPNSTVNLLIGPLAPGSYAFFEEFHEDDTRGTLVVK